MDRLEGAGCSSAAPVFWSAATDSGLSSMEKPLIKLEDGKKRNPDGDHGDTGSLPTLKIDDVKSWIWLQQAIHPEVDYERCMQKRWISRKIKPWKALSIKKWIDERKQRRKEEERLQKAEVHAAISVARVAAMLAAVATDNAERSQSNLSKETVVASAAALVAEQCARAAHALGARQEHIAITPVSTTNATDILMLTAAAATSLRGVATLRGRSGSKFLQNNSTTTISTGEFDLDFEKCIDSLAKGTELHVMTPDGNCKIRLVSVFLNKEAKVVLRVKKINALTPFSSGKESFVYSLQNSEDKEPSTEEYPSYSIVMATIHGTTKLRIKDYVCYKIWITSISHMLKLSTTLSNYELQFYRN